MNIQKCFELLEIDRNASPEEAKQSYKDMVNIWHPDRVSNNPRLKQKAEDKLKEINIAYDIVKSFLSSKKEPEPEPELEHKEASQTGVEREYHSAQPRPGERDKTEATFEAGTHMFLDLCSYVYKTFQRVFDSQSPGSERGNKLRSEDPSSRAPWQSGGIRRGQGRGNGRGKGMGRGTGRGGGMGRGMGRRK